MTALDHEVLAILGPTASGKSAVAEVLAARLGSEVISADALQVYRDLPILTNQPAAPTRLVAIRDLHQEMSVAEYAELAHAAVDEVVAARGVAIVAGGTGLYLRAAIAELRIPPAVDAARRREWELRYDRDPEAAFDELASVDVAAAALVHPHDRRRVVRALELAEIGGSLAPDVGRLWSETMRRPTLVVGLEVPAPELEARIRARTREMLERGALAEAENALRSPISRTAAKALGLSELATLPPDEAAERIAVRTRRYAAYQRKWMRRIPGIVMIDAYRSPEQVVDAILDVARAR